MTGEPGIGGSGGAHGHVPADLALAGETLQALRRLWPGPAITVYVGLDAETGRVHVGWIRDAERKAFRFSAPTMELALERAQLWTRLNPVRAGH